ncbi:MAG: carboxymuconolactone decarboxylase family protein [Chloroflexi bacterium]|nr:carboxymuconolactone decarboxylase family protein [Chloroflexota bacterium]
MARVPYLDREDMPAEERQWWDAIVASRGRMFRPFQALLNSPEAAARLAEFGGAAQPEGGLDRPTRVLAILSTARENDCQFQFTSYTRQAREAGIRPEVVAAIRDRKALTALTPKEALPVRVAQELLRTRRLSDRTYQEAVKAYGLRNAINLVLLVGYYSALALGINALEVELEAGVKPELPV